MIGLIGIGNYAPETDVLFEVIQTRFFGARRNKATRSIANYYGAAVTLAAAGLFAWHYKIQ
jgi:hypothetical protein